jgi:hypothetical protein
MEELPTQFLLGAVALLMLKEVLAFVLSFINKRINGKTKPDMPNKAIVEVLEKYRREYFSPTHRMTVDLHEWHNVNDQDGVKIWYVRPSLAEAVKELSKNIAQQTQILRELARMQLEHQQKEK